MQETVIVGVIVGTVLALALVVVLRRYSDVPAQTGVEQSGLPRRLVETDPDLLRLLAEGRKIEAIKHVRKATGWGLKAAKDYVDHYDRARIAGAGRRGLPVQRRGPDIEAEALRLLRVRGKIEAIRWVRQRTGIGLKEAKEYVESL